MYHTINFSIAATIEVIASGAEKASTTAVSRVKFSGNVIAVPMAQIVPITSNAVSRPSAYRN